MYLKQKSGYVQLRLRFHEQEDNKLMLKQLTNALLIWWKGDKMWTTCSRRQVFHHWFVIYSNHKLGFKQASKKVD